ncbi:hypothetical protein AOZ06_51440 [Kibdelosporangium phytohabitans]|uniref:Peptidoglycan binding-like domain-containing protein n=1 Tax=Kibdelosporangium phytohabitans TaxID=860235 RepID=A0A0N9IFU9_9PSEU|nr:hypothetical protein AOZ06_51440 [Kibdelosporangium phytohabitans]
MKKMLVRAAVLAIFTAGFTAAAGIAGAGTALACETSSQRSDQLAASLPQVGYDDTGPDVLGLQIALRFEGYALNGTGVYSDNTLSAVRDFQFKNGINPSGIVGSKTWHALVGKKSVSITGNGGIQVPGFGIQPGEVNEDKLNAL